MVIRKHFSPAVLLAVFALGAKLFASDLAQPLITAVQSGDAGAVKTLLKKGAAVDTRNGNDTTVLEMASSRGYADLVRILLDNGAKINAQNSFGYTALHYAVYKDFSQVAGVLLAAKADAGIADKEGNTPLHLASERGSVNCVGILLKAGSDVSRKNLAGRTPADLSKTAGIRSLFAGNGGTDDAAGPFTTYQNDMLAEVNFARSDPKGYAAARLKKDRDNSADNGAFQELSGKSPAVKLALNARLCAAAQKYSVFMAKKNVFGHEEDGLGPFKRMGNEGYVYKTAGENIACGSYDEQDAFKYPEEAAIAYVRMLIIDEGVAGAGHRRNILDPAFRELGVGFAQNPASEYRNFTVQDFGTQK